MFPFVKRVRWLMLCLAMSSPALAYQLLPGQPASGGSVAAPASPAADPLGRNTPSGTLYGFLQAAQSGNYSIAAQYLQMSPARRQSEGEQIASQLNAVLNSPDRKSTRLNSSHLGISYAV